MLNPSALPQTHRSYAPPEKESSGCSWPTRPTATRAAMHDCTPRTAMHGARRAAACAPTS
jgi:hypothetical protein